MTDNCVINTQCSCATPFSTSRRYKGVIVVTILDLHVYMSRDLTRLPAHVTILRTVQVEWTVPTR
jgi:hypothetical protein